MYFSFEDKMFYSFINYFYDLKIIIIKNFNENVIFYNTCLFTLIKFISFPTSILMNQVNLTVHSFHRIDIFKSLINNMF
jgi:hypothetical protein